jgi:hypothetical protein
LRQRSLRAPCLFRTCGAVAARARRGAQRVSVVLFGDHGHVVNIVVVTRVGGRSERVIIGVMFCTFCAGVLEVAQDVHNPTKTTTTKRDLTVLY